ncbi:hypothetical protein ACB524_004387 [Salmonella enterica]
MANITSVNAKSTEISESAASFCKGPNVEAGIAETKDSITKNSGLNPDWNDPNMAKNFSQLSRIFNSQFRQGYTDFKSGSRNKSEELLLQYKSMQITATTPVAKTKVAGFKSSIDAYVRGYDLANDEK